MLLHMVFYLDYKLRCHIAFTFMSKTDLIIIYILTILPKNSVLVYQIQGSSREICRQSKMQFFDVDGADFGTGMQDLPPFLEVSAIG